MTKPVPGAGDVEITLAGEKKIMRPTLRAIRDISRNADGIGGAIARVQKTDFDTICLVIVLGLDLTEKGAEGIEDKVFETGLINLAGPCAKYLTILANGGRPMTSGGKESGENPPG